MFFSLGQAPGTNSSYGTKLLKPGSADIAKGFDVLQPGIQDNAPQQKAVNEQLNLRGTMSGLLDKSGQGQRARINQKYDTASNNLRGSLAGRGFAGSSLNVAGQLDVESGRQDEQGQLNDQLLGQRMDSDSGISGNISDLLFGASEQSTDLLGGILGANATGRYGESDSIAEIPKIQYMGANLPKEKDSARPPAKKMGEQPNQSVYNPANDPNNRGGPGGPSSRPQTTTNPFTPNGPSKWGPDDDGIKDVSAKNGSYDAQVEAITENARRSLIRKQKTKELLKQRDEAYAALKSFNAADLLAGGPGDALGGNLNSGMPTNMGMA